MERTGNSKHNDTIRYEYDQQRVHKRPDIALNYPPCSSLFIGDHSFIHKSLKTTTICCGLWAHPTAFIRKFHQFSHLFGLHKARC